MALRNNPYPGEPHPMMALDELVAERLTFENDEDAREAFHARRWSDGLQFVFPTEERVRAMIDGAGRPMTRIMARTNSGTAKASAELGSVEPSGSSVKTTVCRLATANTTISNASGTRINSLIVLRIWRSHEPNCAQLARLLAPR